MLSHSCYTIKLSVCSKWVEGAEGPGEPVLGHISFTHSKSSTASVRTVWQSVGKTLSLDSSWPRYRLPVINLWPKVHVSCRHSNPTLRSPRHRMNSKNLATRPCYLCILFSSSKGQVQDTNRTTRTSHQGTVQGVHSQWNSLETILNDFNTLRPFTEHTNGTYGNGSTGDNFSVKARS